MSRTPSPLGRHVDFRMTPERRERQWAAVSARGPRGRAPSRASLLAALLLVGASAGGIALLRRPAPEPVEGTPHVALVETAEHGGQRIVLADGSRLAVGPSTTLRTAEALPSGVHLELLRGQVNFDVVHRPGRRFSVAAEGFEVLVVGTQFDVEVGRDAHASWVVVDVRKGAVEIRRRGGSVGVEAAGDSWRVGAGETWRSGIGIVAATVPAQSPVPPARAAAVSQPPSRERKREAFATRPVAGAARAPTTVPPRPVLPEAPIAQRPARADARSLLATAEQARLENRPRDAEETLRALVDRYPDDPRAGLAAFELGRLRMDALGDTAGALAAFDEAVARAPDATFREHVEARRVHALDALGQANRCRQARAAYLGRYPQGLHASAVRTRCP